MLEIKELHAFYGAIEALKGINLKVENGQMVCLIGSNGSGKTTLLNGISRMISTSGEIRWNNIDLSSMSPTKVAKQGIMHVPSGRHVFPGLTVEENLELGTVNWRGAFGKANFNDDIAYIYDLFPRLKERKKQLAWSMSGGEQQMLAIGRALMGRPSILLLDEPSMGLAPVVVSEMFEKIADINKQGMTILLVEQNAKIALRYSSYAYILEQGKVTLEGNSQELNNDSRVVQAYLGKLATQNNT